MPARLPPDSPNPSPQVPDASAAALQGSPNPETLEQLAIVWSGAQNCPETGLLGVGMSDPGTYQEFVLALRIAVTLTGTVFGHATPIFAVGTQ
jgi:hypothetical protein